MKRRCRLCHKPFRARVLPIAGRLIRATVCRKCAPQLPRTWEQVKGNDEMRDRHLEQTQSEKETSK
jgi:hypothetical protein